MQRTAMLLGEYDPRFRFLTPALLRDVPDDKLVDAVYDSAVLQMDDESPEPELVDSLPDGIRAVWAAHAYATIMENGGVNLFFWDDSAPTASQALDGLLYVGANEHVLLLREARDRDSRNIDRLLPYRLEGAYDASLSERVFRGLDARYWGLPDLSRTLVHAIRDDPTRFSSW